MTVASFVVDPRPTGALVLKSLLERELLPTDVGARKQIFLFESWAPVKGL